jgi:hypothetical protein
MRYSFEQPQKIRMDIEKPSKGAVLLYNTEVTAKVRVRPFPKMRFFVLEYPLAHKRVSSDSGGTVDRSDLQSRVEALCGKIEALTSKERQQVQSDAALVKDGVFSVSLPEDGGVRRWVFNAKSFLLERIEVLGPAGEVKERFTWEGLKVNPEFSKNFFKEFQ